MTHKQKPAHRLTSEEVRAKVLMGFLGAISVTSYLG